MKERLDKILTDRGYFETKSKAQASIMAGDVKVNGEKITKAGYMLEVKENTIFEVSTMPFVSRGGFKLDKAVKEFELDLKDKICIDAGASTGGFTDCMLQNGAKLVYAVDVGYAQLAWKLRNDKRVVVIEKTNIKNCKSEEIYKNSDDEKAQFASCDLSFISLTKTLPNIKSLLREKDIEIVALIKPQFEAPREEVGKNGVVREKTTHIKIINNILDFVSEQELYPKALTYSPIKGPKGNIEYLIYLTDKQEQLNINVKETVDKAFEDL